MKSAKDLGLVCCNICTLLIEWQPNQMPQQYCPRCGHQLYVRQNAAIERTWAFVIAALICYLPANLLPIMVTTAYDGERIDTIMSGIIYLFLYDSWYLGLIVLVASICIPLFKLIVLVVILWTIKRGLARGYRQRMRLYRIVKIIGRWSMLDVFVVTFVVALVQFKPIMVVTPAPGVIFFAAVVILTMIATETLDSRLIWDNYPTKESEFL